MKNVQPPLPEVRMRINPKGMKQICTNILDQGIPPFVDPYAKKEPFWTVILPKGVLPEYDDALKVTLKEWETVMDQKWPIRPRLKAVTK